MAKPVLLERHLVAAVDVPTGDKIASSDVAISIFVSGSRGNNAAIERFGICDWCLCFSKVVSCVCCSATIDAIFCSASRMAAGNKIAEIAYSLVLKSGSCFGKRTATTSLVVIRSN